MMLKVWLYAFALKVKSTRKLEQRLQEDLGFRIWPRAASRTTRR